MTKLFNSTFEISLRILLMLSVSDESGMTIDRVVAYDFITIYSHNFGLSDSNLHGDNEFSFSEFASRRNLMTNAMKSLVLDNMVSVLRKKDGFRYAINEFGRKFCQQMTTEYAAAYLKLAKKTLITFNMKSEVEILNLISSESMKALRR